MKKFLLLSALIVMGAMQSFAQTFKVGGINYNVFDANNSYVEVTEGSTNAFGNFVIPGYVTDNDVKYKVKRVAENAFFYVNNAHSVTIEEGVTEIQQYAICYCANLTAITLPKTLRTLGQAAFSRNELLPTITFPEGLTTIEKFACMGCTALREVTLPSTLTTINKEAFKECPVGEVYSYATTAPWVNPNAFDDFENIVLHVLPGCGKEYAGAETWSRCTIVEDLGVTPDGVKTLTPSATLGNIYDLQGRVNTTAKGLLIQDGKKVIR